jgi:hypothetical protein
MLLRRRASSSAPAFYRGVPSVNLLPKEHRPAFAAFRAAGWTTAVRVLLLALMAGGAAVYLLTLREVDSYQGQVRMADSRAATAGADIEEALGLMEEINVLGARGANSQADFEFLKGNPAGLITAISSAIALEVDGVSVLGVETSPPNVVTVRIDAASHKDAIKWRRLIATATGVERVVTFDFVQGTEYAYEATLIAGGER